LIYEFFFVSLRDLTANQLSGSIPSGLLKKMQDGSLTLRFVLHHKFFKLRFYNLNYPVFLSLDLVTIQTSAAMVNPVSLRISPINVQRLPSQPGGLRGANESGPFVSPSTVTS
jgi:hypothetical protein